MQRAGLIGALLGYRQPQTRNKYASGLLALQ